MKKRLIVLIIMVTAILMSVHQPLMRAEEPVFAYKNTEGARSKNLMANNYFFENHPSIPQSYLYYEDGQYVRVENINNQIVIERYTSDFKLISSLTREMQLPLYGGAFHGEKYNFLVFGCENPEESDSAEVIRVVKYSLDWQELGHFSTYGDNTTEPFKAGNCSILELKGLLYIRTCHLMYAIEGVNHQANMQYVIKEDDMSLVSSFYGISGGGYVSHSFNQLQCHDDDYVYSFDQGDAHPRGIQIASYQSSLTVNKSAVIYEYPGDTGENYTGVSSSGFEVAGGNLITAINSVSTVDLGHWAYTSQRNVILLVTPLDSFTSDSTALIRITEYEENSGITVRTPELVKISESRLLLMWEEKTEEGFWTKMVLIDNNGQLVSSIIKAGAYLSDCQPILVGNDVVWYSTNNTSLFFYKIDCSSDTSLDKYDEVGVITNDTLKGKLKDYESTVTSDDDTDEIVLYEYIGTSGITDLNELKGDLNICFKIGRQTYRDKKKLKSVILSEEIKYLPEYCFSGCTDLEHIEMPGVEAMEYGVFQYCKSLEELTIPATVEYMNSGIFEGCSNLSKISFETDYISLFSAQWMFAGCTHLKEIDLSVFDTTGVTTMSHMFRNCRNLEHIDLSPLDTSEVEDMSNMFDGCYRLFELDLTGFDTSKVTDMSSMFSDCNMLLSIYVSDHFTTENVTKSDGMFENAYLITGSNGTTYDSSHIDREYAVIDRPGKPGYFSDVVYQEEWKWNSDHSSAAVVLKNSAGNKVAEVNATIGMITEEPTCEDPGIHHYIASAEYQSREYFDVVSVKYAEPTGHRYVFEGWYWDMDYAGSNAYFTCENDYTHHHEEYVPAQVRYVYPNCTDAGTVYYSVNLTFDGKTYSDTQSRPVEPQGHDHVYGKIVWREDDSAYAQCTCRRCGEPCEVQCTVKVISTTAPTCGAVGNTTYEASCTVGGKTYTDTRTVTGKPLRHDVTGIDYQWDVNYESVTATLHCSRCDGFSETAPSASKVLAEPTCQNYGVTRYTAEFTSTYFTPQSYMEETGLVDHKYVFTGFEWGEKYNYALYSCDYCNRKDSRYCWKKTSETTADCTHDGGSTVKLYIEAENSLDGQYHEEEKKGDVMPALGHDYVRGTWSWASDYSSAELTLTCSRNSSHTTTQQAVITSIKDGAVTEYTATVVFEGKTYTDVKKSGSAIVGDPYTRIYGSNRYETSLLSADYLKKLQGVEKFDCVVLAYGQNFPDALSGSYLANLHNAPIILIKAEYAQRVRDYIKNNVNRNGTVYVLGGPAVIPDGWLGSLSNSYNVKRLAGSNRYGSNIEVLKEVGYTGGRILVCVGTNFADSLSASAVKLPILLVGTGLNDDQKAFLRKCDNAEFIIIGGEGAVSSAVEKELGRYGKVTDRLAGTNRFHTSMLIAYHLFEQPSSAVLAYGRNFPDGLSGGSLAYALQGPLLLVENNKSNCNDAAWITYIYGTDRSIILGGTGLISDDIARYVLNLSSKQKIKVITNN